MRVFLMMSPLVATLWPNAQPQVAANAVPDAYPIGTRMVLFRPGGGAGAFDDIHLAQPRIDFFFHGPTPYEAGLVYRTVHPVLVGDPGKGVPSGFSIVVSGMRVDVRDISQELAPQLLPATPTGQNWPAYYAGYRIMHLEVAV
jgi:hypothetical protein